MTDSKRIEGDLIAPDARIAIVVGRFNGYIVESLLAAALDTLHRAGVDAANITVSHVPGALEIPLVVQTFAASGNHDAVIALGEQHRAFEPVTLGENLAQHRHGFLGPVLFVPRDQHNMLALARSALAVVDHPLVLGLRRHRSQQRRLARDVQPSGRC